MSVGVLAFQGDFAEHLALLQSLKVKATDVRSLEDLALVEYLIIPGGESTVMARFLEMTGVGNEIVSRVNKGTLAVYGTCAGAIIVSKKATGKNAPSPLGLIDITIDRNAYGPQTESFARQISVKGIKKPLTVSFIRAPIITKTGKEVEVLAEESGKPVLVKEGRILAGTFHPEVRGETAIHSLFLSL